jgi:hypothetical protein
MKNSLLSFGSSKKVVKKDSTEVVENHTEVVEQPDISEDIPTPEKTEQDSSKKKGFSSKLGSYGASISKISKKMGSSAVSAASASASASAFAVTSMTSVTSALVMGGGHDLDDNERARETGERAEHIAKVLKLVEHFRLQCPQTHAGLVVAFTSTTLSPLIDPNVKFKWYRMGGSNGDQFHQIDESPRGWYPPTADDIGKKICAQCEDNFDQGYCRYAEVGRYIYTYIHTCIHAHAHIYTHMAYVEVGRWVICTGDR